MAKLKTPRTPSKVPINVFKSLPLREDLPTVSLGGLVDAYIATSWDGIVTVDFTDYTDPEKRSYRDTYDLLYYINNVEKSLIDGISLNDPDDAIFNFIKVYRTTEYMLVDPFYGRKIIAEQKKTNVFDDLTKENVNILRSLRAYNAIVFMVFGISGPSGKGKYVEGDAKFTDPEVLSQIAVIEKNGFKFPKRRRESYVKESMQILEDKLRRNDAKVKKINADLDALFLQAQLDLNIFKGKYLDAEIVWTETFYDHGSVKFKDGADSGEFLIDADKVLSAPSTSRKRTKGGK